MDSILFALWFFLPGGFANAAPILAARLPYIQHWNYPIDGGKRFRDKPLFGAHKTWRGLVFGILTAIIIVYFQQLAWQAGNVDFIKSSSMEYLYYSPVLLGFLFGFGALMGDAVESFFKRQHGTPSGKSWFPFDQIDYIIGGCLALALVVRLQIVEYVVILTVWFAMHLVFSYLGYRLRLKSSPV